MMRCRDIRKKMAAWLRRSLPPEEAAVVAAHLSACRSCYGQAQVVRLMHSLLQATLPVEEAELSPQFLTRLRARLAEATPPLTPSLWEGVRAFGQALVYTAVIALALMVGIHLYIQRDATAENGDFFRLVAERNFSPSEQVILADDRDLTSDQVLSALIADRGQR